MSGEEQAKCEGTGIVWRLETDLAIIAYQKKLYTVCEFMRHLANEHGLAQVDLESHVVTQKFHPPVTGFKKCIFTLGLFLPDRIRNQRFP